ncbi:MULTISPECIES: Crp/Fnr family transcriptional regulator [Roseateles]|uniref:Crp/Fnr family transcriptional regulator n=1 Tax=Pelomonas caseinilytica TaxID=2906763 RepID=A0ABS8XJ12_9BURK|nr:MULTISPECIES: Crp/Fnr family transcriptional regulator [unclassified Roseateles]MCE4538536.1 Crp/Fnr family transcriptional regulator [Pelomonas sp. P7]HEV6967011.1 Crp/Fnr family transcriptional regulator [Roseateles sp.]
MIANQLLDHLPAAELRRLLASCAQVPLLEGQPLASQDRPSHGLLFPLQGFICLVTSLDAHLPVQVGMVGREGVLGVQLQLGVAASPVSALVQESGQAWSMTATTLRRALPVSPGLRRLLMRYLGVQLRHSVTAASCLHFHALQARLARWLLMGQDRAQGDGFAVTQEELAHLLGVRRVGVTVAASGLQEAGLIRYHRGWMEVCDRAGLERAACSCYAQDLTSYRLGMKFAEDRPPGSAMH